MYVWERTYCLLRVLDFLLWHLPCHSSTLNVTLHQLCLSIFSLGPCSAIPFPFAAWRSIHGKERVLAAIVRYWFDIHYTVTHHWRLICFYTLRGRLIVDLFTDLVAFWIIHMPFLFTLWLFHLYPFFLLSLFTTVFFDLSCSLFCLFFLLLCDWAMRSLNVLVRDTGKEAHCQMRLSSGLSGLGSTRFCVIPLLL
jgi:hypothetical protein